MSVPVVVLSQAVSVAPQLSAADMEMVAQAGYRSVIINRPDFEGGEQQPTAAAVQAAAKSAGLIAEYQPVNGRAITDEDVARFAELMQTLPQPILAYCRSGTRCTTLFHAASQMLAEK